MKYLLLPRSLNCLFHLLAISCLAFLEEGIPACPCRSHTSSLQNRCETLLGFPPPHSHSAPFSFSPWFQNKWSYQFSVSSPVACLAWGFSAQSREDTSKWSLWSWGTVGWAKAVASCCRHWINKSERWNQCLLVGEPWMDSQKPQLLLGRRAITSNLLITDLGSALPSGRVVCSLEASWFYVDAFSFVFWNERLAGSTRLIKCSPQQVQATLGSQPL